MTVSDWAQVFSAIGTMIAAIVAVAAAIVSFLSSRENRKTNEQMTRPQIAVYIESADVSKNLINLVVSNTGGGIARTIEFSVDGHDLFQRDENQKLSQLRVIQNGIRILPPGGVRKYTILSLVGKYEEILKTHTKINVYYLNNSKTKYYRDEFVLDFASLSEADWQNEDTKAPRNIATELKKIRTVLERKK